IASAGSAEMVGDHSRVPAVDAIAVGRRRLELLRRIVGVEVSAFRAKRAGAAGELFRELAVDLECVPSTVASAAQHGALPHLSSGMMSAWRWTSFQSPSSRRKTSVTRSRIGMGLSLPFIMDRLCWIPVQ